MPRFVVTSKADKTKQDLQQRTATVAPGLHNRPSVVVLREMQDHPDAPPFSANNVSRLYARDWNEIREALVKGTRTIKVGAIILEDGGSVDGVDVSVLDKIVEDMKIDVGALKILVNGSLQRGGGLITGNVSCDEGVLIDGVDISDHNHDGLNSPAINIEDTVGEVQYFRLPIGETEFTIASGEVIPFIRAALTSALTQVQTPANFIKDPSNSPSTTFTNLVPAFVLPDASLKAFYATFRVPKVTTSTLNLSLRYFISSGAEGNVKLKVEYNALSPGNNVYENSITEVFATVDGNVPNNSIKEVTLLNELTGSPSISEGDILTIKITREADGAGDTSTASINVMALTLSGDAIV